MHKDMKWWQYKLLSKGEKLVKVNPFLHNGVQEMKVECLVQTAYGELATTDKKSCRALVLGKYASILSQLDEPFVRVWRNGRNTLNKYDAPATKS